LNNPFLKIAIMFAIFTGTLFPNVQDANAQLIPGNPKDFYEFIRNPKTFFKSNVWWFVGWETMQCVYSYYTGDGYCQQNPNFRLIKVSYNDTVNNSTVPCYGGYNYIAAVGNEYARKNGLKFIAYGPQNKTFTFSN
jgi:hypothetical protein